MNQLLVESFAFNLSYGPSNESGQSLLDFHLIVLSDSADIIASIDVDNSGQLDVLFNNNYGTALIQVSLQDDGGTNNQGDDTSESLEFNVTHSDHIFKSGFEGTNKLTSLEKVLKSFAHLPQPQYIVETDRLMLLGHEFNLNDQNNLQLIEQHIIDWLEEVYLLEYPFIEVNQEQITSDKSVE